MEHAPNEAPSWNLVQRILFRFAFVYFLMYSLLEPLGLIPLHYLPDRIETPINQWLGTWVYQPWSTNNDVVVKWVGRKVFDLEITILPAGSGDTTWNYVQLLCFAAASAGITLLWSLSASVWNRAFPGPKHHRRLHDVWRVFLRVVLGSTLISYGCAKVIPVQMPAPDLDRLCEPIGETSPMGLLWTFLGASEPYQRFSGLAELAAGWLLVTRWTTLAGALMSIAVMTNVALLNFFYDTPVKLYSSHLLLMGVLLTLPDLGRLCKLFVLHRPVPASPLGAWFRWRPLNLVCVVLGVAVFGQHTWTLLEGSRQQYQDSKRKDEFPMRGMWVVKTFEIDGVEAAPDDAALWRRMIVGYKFRMSLERAGDPFERFFTAYDENNKLMTLTRRGAPDWKARLRYDFPAPDTLTLDGSFDGHEIYTELRRIENPEYLLVTRGFHWINEYPNNQ